jgi:hypothetical protein
MRLVGTTKPTIASIRERTHWNSANLQPQDPVTLGLCSQIDLDAEVKKSSKRVTVGAPAAIAEEREMGGTLLPASQTIPGLGDQPALEELPAEPEDDRAANVAEDARVFARLKELTRPDEEEDDEPRP